jgi:glucose-1-phosphate thymidylyltransferase
MKGIVLAGGTGSRLTPLTKIINKHMLPVYDKPMIYYPLRTLIEAGIDEILIISGRSHAGHFLELLGSGSEWGVSFTYKIPNEPGSVVESLELCEDFAEGGNVTVILADNIFQDNVRADVNSFKNGAKVFLKEVTNAYRFGVAELKGDKLIGIEEKPDKPKSNYAVTGIYIYDSEVFNVIKRLKSSVMDTIEMTDVNNHYINQGVMDYKVLDGYWGDAGTFEGLLQASMIVRKYQKRQTVDGGDIIV